ncbi:MAG: hypothetical protein ACLTBV_04770 [Enterocloster bolteae]
MIDIDVDAIHETIAPVAREVFKTDGTMGAGHCKKNNGIKVTPGQKPDALHQAGGWEEHMKEQNSIVKELNQLAAVFEKIHEHIYRDICGSIGTVCFYRSIGP